MKEILKLRDMLKQSKILFTERDLDGTLQLLSKNEYPGWDVICRPGSYGYEQELLEIWIHNSGSTGYLTAEKAFDIIKKYYGTGETR